MTTQNDGPSWRGSTRIKSALGCLWKHQLDYYIGKKRKSSIETYGAPSLDSDLNFGIAIHNECLALYDSPSIARVGVDDNALQAIRDEYRRTWQDELTKAVTVELTLQATLRDCGWTRGTTITGMQVDPDEVVTAKADLLVDLTDLDLARAALLAPGHWMIDLKTENVSWKTGKLYDWVADGKHAFSIQSMLYPLVYRANGYRVDGFSIRRVGRQPPFPCNETWAIDNPQPIWNEFPELLAEAVGRDNHVRDMTAKGVILPRTGILHGECTSFKGPWCAHYDVCKSDSIATRKSRLRTLYT